MSTVRYQVRGPRCRVDEKDEVMEVVVLGEGACEVSTELGSG